MVLDAGARVALFGQHARETGRAESRRLHEQRIHSDACSSIVWTELPSGSCGYVGYVWIRWIRKEWTMISRKYLVHSVRIFKLYNSWLSRSMEHLYLSILLVLSNSRHAYIHSVHAWRLLLLRRQSSSAWTPPRGPTTSSNTSHSHSHSTAGQYTNENHVNLARHLQVNVQHSIHRRISFLYICHVIY